MGNFEEFKFRKTRIADKPLVTITKSGIINFNSATMQRHVKNMQYALLYYSKSDNKIGIKFTNDQTSSAYKIRSQRNEKLGSICGISFLKYYEIDFNNTNQYDINLDEKEQLLIIDLKQNEEKK